MLALKRAYIRVHEAVLAAGMLLIGLWLVAPTATFGASASSQAFGRVAGELGWGFAMVAVGAVQMVAAVRGGHTFRAVAAAPSAVLWIVVLGILAVASPGSTGVPFTLTFAVLNFAAVGFNFTAGRVLRAR